MKTEIIDLKSLQSVWGFRLKQRSYKVASTNKPKIISGLLIEYIRLKIQLKILAIIFQNFQNPLKIIKISRQLNRNRRLFFGNSRLKKMVKAQGIYYWDLYTPGWGTKSFVKFIEAEIHRIAPIKKKTNRFTTIFMAFTKKCPLQCEHCFEWEALNGKESLTTQDNIQILKKMQEKGTSQIQFTGGEPMMKVNLIEEMLNAAKKDTDFRVLTAGYNFTLENAKRLKKAGLTGVMISLDHFEPEQHNNFRGNNRSFEWVNEAVQNANSVGLVTTLSVCLTRTFVTEYNLMRYMDLAKEWGVSFVQLLEPKAVGHYKGIDVSLTKEQELILDAFYFQMNFNKIYYKYPILSYHGYYQRRIGCFAAGNRSIYVDTDGNIQACPFCQDKIGYALSDDADKYIDHLMNNGCHSYKSADI